jgi:hypothetical protein
VREVLFLANRTVNSLDEGLQGLLVHHSSIAGEGSRLIRLRGTMLWFNVAKDLGALRTDDGERIDVPGSAFLPGEKPVGRCAGRAVEFVPLDRAVTRLAFVPEPNPRRARMRRRH